MKETGRKILVVYEDNASALAAAAKEMARAAGMSGAVVWLRTASAVSVSEALAADCFIFGVDSEDMPSYAELKRLFKGVNLAGRKASFFLTPESKGAMALKSSLRDTDVSFPTSDFVLGADSSALSAWLKSAMNP